MKETSGERITRMLNEIVSPEPEKDPSPDELARSILESSGSVARPTVTPAEVEAICAMNPDDMDPFELAIYLGAKT
jgi:hypothetical protein